MALMGMNFGEAEEERFVPVWLRSLLRAKFFKACPAHPNVAKNECNHYCLNCTGDSICSLCLPDHADHRVVQIRRSSYHDAIRVAELKCVADVSLVQTYALNSDRVVFLNERPLAPGHASRSIGDAGACGKCGRGIMDEAFRFCCLACKLAGMASDPNLTFILDPEHKWEPDNGAGTSTRRPDLEKFLKTGQISYRRRPRKAVHREPERAPLS